MYSLYYLGSTQYLSAGSLYSLGSTQYLSAGRGTFHKFKSSPPLIFSEKKFYPLNFPEMSPPS